MKSPCNTCPENTRCFRADCLLWRKWFQQVWASIRRQAGKGGTDDKPREKSLAGAVPAAGPKDRAAGRGNLPLALPGPEDHPQL